MADIAQTISQQTGIPIDLVQKGIGAILSFLKQHLGSDVYEKLKQVLPDHSNMVTAFEESNAGTGASGLLTSVAGLAGKLLGGSAGEGAKLFEGLSRAGLNIDQIGKFLPKVVEYFEKLLPPEVFAKVTEMLSKAANSPGV